MGNTRKASISLWRYFRFYSLSFSLQCILWLPNIPLNHNHVTRPGWKLQKAKRNIQILIWSQTKSVGFFGFFLNFIWYKSSFLQHLLIFLTFCDASNICSVIQTSWCESEVIPSCITIASIAKNPTRWTCRATQSNTTLVKVNDKPFPPFLPLESHHITEQPRKSWK